MQTPNLFVVGSMKCGTTILSDFLAAHPQVTVARGKEVHFFTMHEDKGLGWYLDHFDQDPKFRYRVDASPTYFDIGLFTPVARKIKALSPDARIIVLIRDPLERAISHLRHLQSVNRVPELQGLSLSDFLGGSWDDALVMQSVGSMYKNHVLHFSAYARKIAEYVRIFGDRVMVIDNADLREHGPAVMADVWSFLEIEPVEADFSVQRYLGGTDVSAVDPALRLRFYMTYGPDYFASHTAKGPRRPRLPEGESLSGPCRAIVQGVLVGREGRLFDASDSDMLVARLGPMEAVDAAADTWLASMREDRRRLEGVARRVLHVIIPDKLTTYAEDTALGLQAASSPAYRVHERAGADEPDHIVHLVDFLRVHRSQHPVFPKTGSAMTDTGHFMVYQMIMARLGMGIRNDLLSRPAPALDTVLDLGARLATGPVEHVTTHMIRAEPSDPEPVRADDPVALRYRNPAAPHRETVLLVGERLATDSPLVALFAETFPAVTVVPRATVDPTLAAEIGPDIVLFIADERDFLSWGCDSAAAVMQPHAVPAGLDGATERPSAPVRSRDEVLTEPR